MGARGTRRISFGLAIVASAAAFAIAIYPSPSAGRGLSVARAEAAARKAVLAHPSYRRISSTRTGLVTRSCRRLRRSAVRCRLYTVVSSPCALEQEPDTVCAQALWERRWLVEVRRRDGAADPRIIRISAGPATGDAD